MNFERYLITIVCLFFATSAAAQDLSNKGTEFWVGYGYHHAMTHVSNQVENEQDMVLYFTADENAIVKVDIPRLGWSKTYQVSATNVTESDPMPKSGSQDARLILEQIYPSGIHITSDKPIVAYAHIYNMSVSGATLLFPVATLGQDYYSLNFTQRSNASESNSWAYVIATEDNTNVEIIPSANTLKHTVGQAFTVTLNKGEVYNLMGTTSGNIGGDLTGTRIHSVSTGSAGCKKIAVFSGSGRLSIYCDNTVTSSDNLIQQVFPSSAWGKKFLTVPTAKLTNNYFRIAVSDPSTVVTVDGSPLNNLVKNFYYDILANSPKSIVSNKPIMVAQYITSTNSADGPTCSNSFNGNGDPEMIYISPVEQTIDKITLNSTTHFKITSHYINVVIKSSAINSFTLDGATVSSSFTTHPYDPLYSYAVFTVAAGPHRLQADSGFNAIAYGYGAYESYGYNAGTNIKDLYQFLTLRNKYATVNLPLTCRNTNFSLSVTLPYKASSLSWDFGGDSHISPNNVVTQNNPLPDSSYMLDGRNLYVYSLPSSYSFNATGSYPLKVIANNQTSDGCNGTQQINYTIQVIEPPSTDFTFTHAGCVTDSVYFKDASNANGRQLKKWLWEFGAGSKDSVMNPRTAFSQSGTYNIKETSINDIGCATDTVKPFTIAPQPVANFSFTKLVCEGTAVTFTDASSIAAGKIVKWYWNLGIGNTITNSTGADVKQVYAAGTYTVSLQVENESGCKSTLATQTITVNAAPKVNFDMPGACLPSAVAVFTNGTTISDGSQNLITYVWTFGDGGASTEKSPLHTYTTSGPFAVHLKATAGSGCATDSTKNFSNIYPQPVAAFTYNPSKICASDSVRFADASTGSNSAVTSWFWKLGEGTTSTNQNPFYKYADSGSYRVSLSVKSVYGCASDTVQKAIYINKTPAAAFTISASTCQNEPFTIIDQSKANSGTITNWYWKFGDGTTETHSNGNPFTKQSNAAGNYYVSLIVQTDNGCKSDSASRIAVVKPLPVAAFVSPLVCVNDPYALFKDSSYMPGTNSTGTFTYSWSFGDPAATPANANTSAIQNPQHKYQFAGTYNVALTVTAVSGCSATTTKAITISGGAPKTDFSIIDVGAVCSNSAIRIKSNASIDIGSIIKVQVIWDAQDNPGVIITDDTPSVGKIYTHTYPPQQIVKTFQVKMIAYSGANCFTEKVIPVTVNPSPAIVFSAIPGICLNDAP
ncbi:MAG: PKD domain-containing protein, partial [Bacteroidota bacterium]|nr:PKD domain-containing protein [Bacteroidota bacterium]